MTTTTQLGVLDTLDRLHGYAELQVLLTAPWSGTDMHSLQL